MTAEGEQGFFSGDEKRSKVNGGSDFTTGGVLNATDLRV